MIPELGLFSLILALMMSLVLTVLPTWGLLSPKRAYLQKMTTPAVYGQWLFVTLSFITLVFSFVNNDFSIGYVAHNSHTLLPLIYKMCATWGAHEGSLLLWALILSIWTLAVAIVYQKHTALFFTRVKIILGAVNVGILLLLLQTSNPFLRLLPFAPEDGVDLNPLLQDPAFVSHPPFLYMGYVGFAVPFAFAIAALWQGDKTLPWAQWARPWSLLAWGFLTIGIMLGSWWAYYELGWGGWWFWDPVENASFMPWLMGAALSHALLVCTKKKLFNSWCLLLAICTFLLSLMGTFLVRSGILSSVHSFASDPLRGTYILSFLAIVLIGSLGLYFNRITLWKSEQRPALLSKAAFILLANMILVVATATVLLGTLYPLMMEVFLSERISVGPPYFNAVFVPIVLPIFILMAVAPHLRWEKENAHLLRKRMQKTSLLLIAGAVLVIGCTYAILPPQSLIGLLLGLGMIGGTLKLLHHLNWRRIAMILAHLGLGVTVLGISLTTALETEKEMKMAPSEKVHIKGYDFTFEGIEDIQGPNFVGKKANFLIEQQGKKIAQVYPEKRFFIPRQMPLSETAIHVGIWQDFYIALGEKLDNDNWSVRLYMKPFVRWVWLGGLFIALGAILSGLMAFQKKEEEKI